MHVSPSTDFSNSVPVPGTLNVIRRNGTLSAFEPSKIAAAVTKAFLAVEGPAASGSARVHDAVESVVETVMGRLTRRVDGAQVVHIEDIQDAVELALMRGEHHKVARAYVLYREERARERAKAAPVETAKPSLRMKSSDGALVPLDDARLAAVIAEACDGLDGVDVSPIQAETARNLYDGITLDELALAPILASRTLIETEPNYAKVTARLLLDKLRREVLSSIAGVPEQATHAEMSGRYADYFRQYVAHGIGNELLDPELDRFDLERLGAAIKPERDLQFDYMGLQALYDRYLIHVDGARFEMPQAFFMRVAMGLAIREVDRETRAIEFYEALSSFRFMSSTPTLFNAGTQRPQLASCFLTTIPDDLKQIFKCVGDNAQLAKYSGGIGNDWTNVRALKSWIKGTNGPSLGIVPFLKVANDTAVAVNQGGKRAGAVCGYLETWHLDVEEFLDLRKNTGDERRRTHDMNTANWIPDLFMQRVEAGGDWTLFSPNEVPDLHDLYGKPFKVAYEAYEAKAARGEMRLHRTVKAVDLWRRMLTMLFETGHPWITFKDPCNLRSPQQHVGVVHSSNLCTEITLNTSFDEVAVCNIGSVNLYAHVGPEGIDAEALARTVTTAMRMLDNVIDINLYNIPEARRSNLRHRPVGIGMMGFQDALVGLRIPYASEAAVEFADRSMELLSYHAIAASADLALERGSYSTFEGSLWSKGILPIDSLEILSAARDGDVDLDRSSTLDWAGLRERVKRGMRNSNTMAIAPTATISNIVGVSQSIEPSYSQLYVKANMSGDFTVLSAALVRDLKALGLWDEVMVSDLKYHDGKVSQIERIPDELKALYATSFEIEPQWLIRAAARRQKWIDQGQSLNIYMAQTSGRKLDETYRLAWRLGLKTTYYLRALGASHVEKSTLKGTDGKLNAVSAVVEAPVAKPAPVSPILSEDLLVNGAAVPMACSIDNPDCEACQ